MKHFGSLLFVCLYFYFLSCQKGGNIGTNDMLVIVIDLDQTTELSDSPVFNRFVPVELEVTDNSLLADIGKVVCMDKKIYVFSG